MQGFSGKGNEDILNRAIIFIYDGDINQAKQVLAYIITQNREYLEAWRLLSVCVKKDAQINYCRSRIVRIREYNLKTSNDKSSFDPTDNNTPVNDPISYVHQRFTIEQSQESKRIEPYNQIGLPIKSAGQSVPQEKSHFQAKKGSIEPKISKISKEGSNLIEEKAQRLDKRTHYRALKNIKNKEDMLVEPRYIRAAAPGENLFAINPRIPCNFIPLDAGLFGSRLVIEDVEITPFDCPECLKQGNLLDHEECDFCLFFGYDDCPILKDPDLLHEVYFFYSQMWDQMEQHYGERNTILSAIYSELKAHGRPLHYETIAKIVVDRYPNLEINPRRVYKLMSHNPNQFENVNVGVYRAI